MVKAYNGEDNARREFDRLNNQLKDSAFMAQSLAGLMQPLMTFIGNFGYVAVCIVGAVLTMRGTIGFEVIVAFMMYVRYFTQPLSQMAQAVQSPSSRRRQQGSVSLPSWKPRCGYRCTFHIKISGRTCSSDWWCHCRQW